MKLAYLIKSRRIERGYFQEYMAMKIGISQSAYSRIENKAENEPFHHILALCRLLEIDKVDIEKIFFSSTPNEK